MYNKKISASTIDRRVRKRVEERDAIVWSIDVQHDIVNVKIQGSDTLIKAHYHQVLTQIPSYVKVGSAVTIRHRRGNKGYVEVVGTGRAIPSPVTGGTAIPPTSLIDAVLTGMEVYATDPASLAVGVNSGTFRYNNTIYVFSGTANFFYTMNDPSELLMGSNDVTMGGQYFALDIPAAPATPQYGRYDLIVIGTDGDLDVISGTAVNLSTTEPAKPSVPSNHVLVDWIFIMYGDTVITSDMIGKNYQAPAPQEITTEISGSWVDSIILGYDALEWNANYSFDSINPYCTITISAIDQYGGTIQLKERVKLTLNGGYGEVKGSYTDWSSSYAESYYNTSVSFTYRRDQSQTEFSPVLTFEATSFANVYVLPLISSGGGRI
jgi:hypothetical protein